MYLKKLRNDLRVIFTKLRNCNHKLPIETGRCKYISVSVTYHVYNLSHNASDIELVGAHQRSYFNRIAYHKNILISKELWLT